MLSDRPPVDGCLGAILHTVPNRTMSLPRGVPNGSEWVQTASKHRDRDVPKGVPDGDLSERTGLETLVKWWGDSQNTSVSNGSNPVGSHRQFESSRTTRASMLNHVSIRSISAESAG